MLYPKKTRDRLAEEHLEFRKKYDFLLTEMKNIMLERGEVRDTSTPIYYRRSPHDCLGLAKHKALRIESLLSSLNVAKPHKGTLEKIIEECVDASNYLLFIAALALLVIEGETR